MTLQPPAAPGVAWVFVIKSTVCGLRSAVSPRPPFLLSAFPISALLTP
jgi:hypothetical protein